MSRVISKRVLSEILGFAFDLQQANHQFPTVTVIEIDLAHELRRVCRCVSLYNIIYTIPLSGGKDASIDKEDARAHWVSPDHLIGDKCSNVHPRRYSLHTHRYVRPCRTKPGER